MPRVYQGGSSGSDWFTFDYNYAKGYADEEQGGTVKYVDIPNDHPFLETLKDEYADEEGSELPHRATFQLPADLVSQKKEINARQAVAGELLGSLNAYGSQWRRPTYQQSIGDLPEPSESAPPPEPQTEYAQSDAFTPTPQQRAADMLEDLSQPPRAAPEPTPFTEQETTEPSETAPPPAAGGPEATTPKDTGGSSYRKWRRFGEERSFQEALKKKKENEKNEELNNEYWKRAAKLAKSMGVPILSDLITIGKNVSEFAETASSFSRNDTWPESPGMPEHEGSEDMASPLGGKSREIVDLLREIRDGLKNRQKEDADPMKSKIERTPVVSAVGKFGQRQKEEKTGAGVGMMAIFSSIGRFLIP